VVSAEETVRIDISIQINTEDVVDTGYTIAQWNAMTPTQRGAVLNEIWNDTASNSDSGGMRVATDGAEEI
jgi:hypothetical protein